MMQGSLSVGTLFMMVDLAMNFITPVVTLFNEFNQVKSTVPMWKKTQKALNYEIKENSEKAKKFEGLDVPSQRSALAQGVSYKQIISGFFFAFAALTYLISAQPNMNGLATGFILSQTSVVLATLTGIWFLHEKKTKKEMVVTLIGLAIIIGAATMTVIV